MLDGFWPIGRSGTPRLALKVWKIFAQPEPGFPAGILMPRAIRVPDRYPDAESDQEEIDQRDQGCANAAGNQGVVGTDVGLRIER